jgi:hypothetical protein
MIAQQKQIKKEFAWSLQTIKDANKLPNLPLKYWLILQAPSQQSLGLMLLNVLNFMKTCSDVRNHADRRLMMFNMKPIETVFTIVALTELFSL